MIETETSAVNEFIFFLFGYRDFVVHEKQYVSKRIEQRQHYTQCERRIVQTSERR